MEPILIRFGAVRFDPYPILDSLAGATGSQTDFNRAVIRPAAVLGLASKSMARQTEAVSDLPNRSTV